MTLCTKCGDPFAACHHVPPLETPTKPLTDVAIGYRNWIVVMDEAGEIHLWDRFSNSYFTLSDASTCYASCGGKKEGPSPHASSVPSSASYPQLESPPCGFYARDNSDSSLQKSVSIALQWRPTGNGFMVLPKGLDPLNSTILDNTLIQTFSVPRKYCFPLMEITAKVQGFGLTHFHEAGWRSQFLQIISFIKVLEADAGKDYIFKKLAERYRASIQEESWRSVSKQGQWSYPILSQYGGATTKVMGNVFQNMPPVSPQSLFTPPIVHLESERQSLFLYKAFAGIGIASALGAIASLLWTI